MSWRFLHKLYSSANLMTVMEEPAECWGPPSPRFDDEVSEQDNDFYQSSHGGNVWGLLPDAEGHTGHNRWTKLHGVLSLIRLGL